MTHMQREIDVLRATEQTFRKKTLELELDNDDLERTERYAGDFSYQVWIIFRLTVGCYRAAQSSLADIEMKYNKAIERNAILGKLMTI
jgi:hypothetical protein